jgi:Holliday junction resolvase RusA-like endonuclease
VEKEHEQQLAIRIIFHMKRPKHHFVSSKSGPGRLKAGAPPRLSPTRTDVDNLAKFVLDSLNGVLYVDDKQVAFLSVFKLYDNDGHCEGCTEVSIVRLSEQHVDDLLQSGVVQAFRLM